jgi:hypothetical protein
VRSSFGGRLGVPYSAHAACDVTFGFDEYSRLPIHDCPSGSSSSASDQRRGEAQQRRTLQLTRGSQAVHHAVIMHAWIACGAGPIPDNMETRAAHDSLSCQSSFTDFQTGEV